MANRKFKMTSVAHSRSLLGSVGLEPVGSVPTWSCFPTAQRANTAGMKRVARIKKKKKAWATHLNAHSNPTGRVLPFHHFMREKKGSERLSNFPKVTLLTSSKAGKSNPRRPSTHPPQSKFTIAFQPFTPTPVISHSKLHSFGSSLTLVQGKA